MQVRIVIGSLTAALAGFLFGFDIARFLGGLGVGRPTVVAPLEAMQLRGYSRP